MIGLASAVRPQGFGEIRGWCRRHRSCQPWPGPRCHHKEPHPRWFPLPRMRVSSASRN